MADAAELGRTLGVTRHVCCIAVGHVQREADDERPAPDADPASGGEGYDGVRELWWPDLPALERGLSAHPDTARALLAPAGVDAARSSTLVAQERVIVA